MVWFHLLEAAPGLLSLLLLVEVNRVLWSPADEPSAVVSGERNPRLSTKALWFVPATVDTEVLPFRNTVLERLPTVTALML